MPTPEGKWLAVVLRESFDAIESTLAQMRQPAEAATATLSCSPSFAMSWLTPRLGDFFRQHPHTGLRVFGEFHTLDRTRMVRDGVEAAVRFDLGGYRDLNATVFLDEWLSPWPAPSSWPATRPSPSRKTCTATGCCPTAAPGTAQTLTRSGSTGLRRGAPRHRPGRAASSSTCLNSPWAQRWRQGIAMGRAALVLQDVKAGRWCRCWGAA